MNASKLQQYRDDPLAFLADLVIPSAHGPARFGDVMAEFQRERFASISPALVAVSRGERPPIGRHWWEATKGASKDSDLACCLLWLLAFTRRPLDCQVGAADQDQAAELKKAARDILHLNRWLADRVKIQNWRIVCEATQSAVDIIAADVAGSHGARPDVLVCNELSHLTKQEFAENLMDNAAKVPHGLAIIATNAGFLATFQHRWRELARTSDRWHFHVRDKPAPWLDETEIDEAKLRNSTSRYMRLWWGRWASGAGDALDAEDIEACITLLGPMTRRPPEGDWAFIGGLDLGISNDHAAFVVLGVHRGSNRIALCDCRSWKPPRGGQIDLMRIEEYIVDAHRRFRLSKVFFDPFQAVLLAQRLMRARILTEPMNFVGRNLDLMASAILETFASRVIDLYHDKELIRDLSRLSIVEKSYGYKLESTRDADGHADRATALAICLPDAMRLAHLRAYPEPRAPAFVSSYNAVSGRFGIWLNTPSTRI